MLNAGKFWEGYSLIVAQGVFLGTIGAMLVQGLARLAWLGVTALWTKYGPRTW